MSAPTATADALQRAMADFDRGLRGTSVWMGWEQNKAHKFAIQDGAQLYPVKCILSIATGVPVSDFSGGERPGETAAAVRAAGLTVVRPPGRV